jgi:hypothetical protein
VSTTDRKVRAFVDGPERPKDPDAWESSSEKAADVAAPATRPGREYPSPLARDAFVGPLGALVQLIGPASEADPAALLAQALVLFGNVIGRGPHLVAESRPHYSNLFVAIVAASSKGRKGSSLAQMMRPFREVDEHWTRERQVSGLSSGEGLIWAVRDAIPAELHGKGGDAGVTDKRLLVVEEELGGVLANMARQGNTLSAVTRSAWDTGELRALTKNTPARSTGAHVSVIGHVVREELVRNLSATEQANGFANRFLWVSARRSKCLPFGGTVDERDIAAIARELSAAIDGCRKMGELPLSWSPAARELWIDVYPELSEGRPGLLGAVTSRAEAQVLRLSLVYALTQASREISLSHLHAGLAVWSYCASSAEYIFGASLGDPLSDRVLTILRGAGKGGVTRRELLRELGGHTSAAALAQALGRLVEENVAEPREQRDTGGRPSERWMLRAASKRAKSLGSATEQSEQSEQSPSSPLRSATGSSAEREQREADVREQRGDVRAQRGFARLHAGERDPDGSPEAGRETAARRSRRGGDR